MQLGVSADFNCVEHLCLVLQLLCPYCARCCTALGRWHDGKKRRQCLLPLPAVFFARQQDGARIPRQLRPSPEFIDFSFALQGRLITKVLSINSHSTTPPNGRSDCRSSRKRRSGFSTILNAAKPAELSDQLKIASE